MVVDSFPVQCKRGFFEFPLELQTYILDCLEQPTHIAKARRVCRQWHLKLMPALCCEMDVQGYQRRYWTRRNNQRTEQVKLVDFLENFRHLQEASYVKKCRIKGSENDDQLWLKFTQCLEAMTELQTLAITLTPYLSRHPSPSARPLTGPLRLPKLRELMITVDSPFLSPKCCSLDLVINLIEEQQLRSVKIQGFLPLDSQLRQGLLSALASKVPQLTFGLKELPLSATRQVALGRVDGGGADGSCFRHLPGNIAKDVDERCFAQSVSPSPGMALCDHPTSGSATSRVDYRVNKALFHEQARYIQTVDLTNFMRLHSVTM